MQSFSLKSKKPVKLMTGFESVGEYPLYLLVPEVIHNLRGLC